MSYSKSERGKFIRSRMMDIALREGAVKIDGFDYFSEIYELIGEVSVAGNPTTERCSKNITYLRALKDWQQSKERFKNGKNRTGFGFPEPSPGDLN